MTLEDLKSKMKSATTYKHEMCDLMCFDSAEEMVDKLEDHIEENFDTIVSWMKVIDLIDDDEEGVN